MTLAMRDKKLHRNFMGYTTQETPLLIGLGMSAISDSWFGFAQNEKSLEEYQNRLKEGKLPILRGHILSEEDVEIRKYILSLMCHFQMNWGETSSEKYKSDIRARLKEMVTDELIRELPSGFQLTEKGIPFVRNACMAFDTYLHEAGRSEKPLFSKTI
jgi:oxygen-independent coproporphyrinogen-3 oxidase